MPVDALSKWPAFRSLTSGNSLSMLAARFADPEQIEFHEKMVKAGKAAAAVQKEMSTFDAEMEALGHTNLSPGGAGAPFDIISDSLRGMRGAMMDMYRCPDKLIKVCEMYVGQSLQRAAVFAKNSKNKRSIHGPAPRLRRLYVDRPVQDILLADLQEGGHGPDRHGSDPGTRSTRVSGTRDWSFYGNSRRERLSPTSPSPT